MDKDVGSDLAALVLSVLGAGGALGYAISAAGLCDSTRNRTFKLAFARSKIAELESKLRAAGG